ncbi:hypothetical protein ACH5RR_013271 [Cinchona calisaya]|uniref:Uncharacterized protein n=1 Tax=Cinchona calisaya TaxID=153742 RepID=A0ABD3A0W9_9GENT
MKSRAFMLVALLCALFLLVSSTMAADTPKDETKEDKAKEPEQYGGRCRFGCCGWGRNGCQRCCRTADEAAGKVNVDINARGGDGGGFGGGGRGGGGGHCRFGCCGGRGRYCRCCYNPEEAYMQNEN